MVVRARTVLRPVAALRAPQRALNGFSAAQQEQRNLLLRTVYASFHAAKDSSEQDALARSGNLFAEHWKLFRSRVPDHTLLDSALLSNSSLKQSFVRPYRIDPALAARLTAVTCRLEGSLVTAHDVESLGVDPDAVFEPLDSVLVSFIASSKRSKRSEKELMEAYFHMLALYQAQAITLGRPQFYLTLDELKSVHRTLMFPFQDKSPGQFRKHAIQVKGYHLACFPFAKELEGLMTRFAEWLKSPPQEDSAAHPFLRACDIFLVFAHLHPFYDGNGRLGRLLFSLAMAHGGCRPIVLHDNRTEYLAHVYAAQHEFKVVDFYSFVLSQHQ
jgi:fido (protein-threonine AMPylation protein)